MNDRRVLKYATRNYNSIHSADGMLYIYRTENCIFFLRCFLRRVLFARVRVFKRQFIYHSRAIHWEIRRLKLANSNFRTCQGRVTSYESGAVAVLQCSFPLILDSCRVVKCNPIIRISMYFSIN